MLCLNTLRAQFAAYLVENAAARHSLDAALMHVAERAYQQGMQDALSVPAVLAEPVAVLDAGMAPGVRGALAAWPVAGVHVGLHGPAFGATQAGGAAVRDQPPAANDLARQRYGCHNLPKRCRAPWTEMPCGHDWRGSDPFCDGCANLGEV